MNDPLKSKKRNLSYEINWNIREIFSESALYSFFDELDQKYVAIEKNKE